MNLCNQYNRFVRFVGDILITDPCYIIREDRKMNYNAYPKMEDYYSKYKIIGNGQLKKEVPLDFIKNYEILEDKGNDIYIVREKGNE